MTNKTNPARRLHEFLTRLVASDPGKGMTKVWSKVAYPHLDVTQLLAVQGIVLAKNDLARLRLATRGLDLDASQLDEPLASIDACFNNSLANIGGQWSAARHFIDNGVLMAVRFWIRELAEDEAELGDAFDAVFREIIELRDRVSKDDSLTAEERDRAQVLLSGLIEALSAYIVGGELALTDALTAWFNTVRRTYESRVTPSPAEAGVIKKAAGSVYKYVVKPLSTVAMLQKAYEQSVHWLDKAQNLLQHIPD